MRQSGGGILINCGAFALKPMGLKDWLKDKFSPSGKTHVILSHALLLTLSGSCAH